MPLGLLRFTPTTIIHAFIVELHKKIVSRVSSKKYQFPEIQSNAICVIAENITNNLLIHILTNNILLMKKQFVIIHIIHQTWIHTLLDSWVTHRTSVKMLCPQKNLLLHIFL